jgi:hypothetical protein
VDNASRPKKNLVRNRMRHLGIYLLAVAQGRLADPVFRP